MAERFQVTPSLAEFWIDNGETATLTNIGSSTIYGADVMFPNTASAAWSLAAGATRVEDNGAVWVRTASGTSSTLTVDPIASGTFVDVGLGTAVVSGASASAVTFTPTGTIAATDVQAAIAEVAAEAGGGGVSPWAAGTVRVANQTLTVYQGSVWLARTTGTDGAAFSRANWAPVSRKEQAIYNATPTSLKFARAAAARAAAGGADLRVRCTGDSITAGSFATNPATDAWPAKLLTRLANAGRFTGARRGPTYLNAVADGGAGTTRDSRITAVGAGWGQGNNGYVYAGAQAAAPAGKLQFTPDQTVDTFVITWARYGTVASLLFYLDGSGTVNTTQSINGSQAVGVTTITTTLGSHTLEIGATGDTVFVHSIDAYNSAQVGGVRVANAANPGLGLYQVAPDYTYGALSAGWAGFIPDIDFIHLGTNDVASSFTTGQQATFVTNLTTLVNRARANNCDPILLVPIPAGAGYGGANHPALVDCYYQVADTLDVALIDLDARWRSDASAAYAAPFSFMQSDFVHGTSKGYADMANGVAAGLLAAI